MSPKHFLWSCTKFVLCGLTGLMGLLGMCIFTALSLEPLTFGAAAIALLGFGLMITVYAEGISRAWKQRNARKLPSKSAGNKPVQEINRLENPPSERACWHFPSLRTALMDFFIKNP